MSLESLSVVSALPEQAAPGRPDRSDRPEPSGRYFVGRAWPGPRARISLAAVALVLTLWQLSGSLRWIDPLLLPPPSDIWVAAQELLQSGYRQTPPWQHVAISAGRAVAAFAVAIVVGVPLGLGMGRWPTLAAVFDPFVQFLRPLPKIALIPLVIVWFGIGEGAKFFLIFISSFLSIVVGAAAAAQGVSQARIRAAQTLGASPRQVFSHVLLPDALPGIFTSVRLSVGIGWTSLIAAEMVAANAGLGWMVINAGTYLRTDVVLLGIVLLGLTGYLFDALLLLAQRRLVPWAGRDA